MKDKEKKQISPKTKKILSIVGDVVFFSVVGIFVLFALLNGIDQHSGYKVPLFGMRTSVIVSESMEHKNPSNSYLTDDMYRINKFDVITTKNYKSYDDIKLYDVITYYGGE